MVCAPARTSELSLAPISIRTRRVQRNWLAAIGLILVAVFVYAPHINHTIDYDEAYTLRHYSDSPAHALLDYTVANNHLLHSFLVWLATSLAGQSLMAIRFPAFAAGLISLACSFRLAAKLADYVAGLVAMTFMMTHLVFANYTFEARGYSLGILLTFVFLELILAPGKWEGRATNYALVAVSSGLILVMPSMAILIAGSLVWCLWKNRRLIIPITTGAVAGFIFYAPSLVKNRIVESVGWYGNTNLLGLLEGWLASLFFSPAAIGIVLAGSVVVGLVWLYGHRRILFDAFAVLGAVIIGLAPLQLAILHTLFYPRNYLFLLAPIVVIGGVGLSRIIRNTVWLVVPLVLLVGLLAISHLSLISETDVLLTHIKQNMGQHDSILIGCCENEQVWYYLGQDNQAEWLLLGPNKTRLFVVETQEQSREEVLAQYSINIQNINCLKVKHGWEPFDVSVCTFR